MSCECNPLLVGEAGPQGPQGLSGVPGSNGINGVNAYSTTTASFVQPSVGGSVGVLVDNNSWIGQSQILYIAATGYYQVTGIAGTTGLTLSLLQTDGVSVGATASSARKVSPSGNVVSTASLPSLSVSGSSTFQQGISVNASGINSDTVVQGENDSSLIFVDASADRVGIGTNAPTTKLDVSGSLRASGTATMVAGAIVNDGQSSTGDFQIKGQTATNLLFADASVDRIGINKAAPLNALLDVGGAVNAETAVINPALATGNVFTVRGGSSTYRIHVVDDAVGIGTSVPSIVGVGAGQTNMTVNGVLNTVKLAVGSGTVASGIIRMNYGIYTFPASFNLNANTATGQDVAVTGSQQGDFILVGANGLNTNASIEGVTIHAQVTSAGTVRVSLRNHTGSTIVLSAGTTIQVLALGAQALP